MKTSMRDLRLDYLWTCGLTELPGPLQRNVRLQLSPKIYNKDKNLRSGIWSYKNAHRLELRDPNCGEGIWPISNYRSLRTFGNLLQSEHADGDIFDHKRISDFELAKPLRCLCYRRVVGATEAANLVQSNRPIDYSCEITNQWYDPPQGEIPKTLPQDKFVGSHAFCLLEYDAETRRFVFPNSWGMEWGALGWGSYPIENWETDLIDAWASSTYGVSIPNKLTGLICRGWKLGYQHGDGSHCVEIYDADNDNYLAWAFCVVRGQYLDVDEFFVRPESRNLGYAKKLCDLVKRLQRFVNRPLRLIVSFADAESYSLAGAESVAKLLGLKLQESNVRWAAMLGTEEITNAPKRSWKPARPASMLEYLRSSDETPDEQPRQYTVFYGTDRKLIDENSPEKGFLNERGRRLQVGSCLVELPKTHKFGSVGRNWLSIFNFASQRSLRLVLIKSLTQEQFTIDAGHALAQHAPEQSQNLLYIHGFNCSFDDAAVRAAQLGYDLKIPGCTFFYSWPSAAKPLNYAIDEATVDTSVEHCFQFVMEILNAFPKTPLNIVAHSMGNRLAINLFERIAQLEVVPKNLGQLIFAAPDVDVDRFSQSIVRFMKIAKRMTLYSSKGDFAVQLSEIIHKYPRVGLAPPLTIIKGVDTILVEGFNLFDFDGHGYYAEASGLLTDMFNLVRYGAAPENRPRIRNIVDPVTSDSYWSLHLG